jgi:peptide/nickel transport system permease protein
VYAYLVRRLLWMVPTLFGILLINFGVLRLQGDSFEKVLKEQAEGGPGEKKARAIADQNLEGALLELAPTGNLLPALINLRGFVDKDEAVAWLARAEDGPGRSPAARHRAAKSIWSAGWLLVEPLAAVLADDQLQRLHGPASRALVLCAYSPPTADLRDRLGAAGFAHLQARNRARQDLAIRFANDAQGYRTGPDTDPDYAAKRADLLAFCDRYRADFDRTGRRWNAVLGETGFTHFLGRLCTGQLYSHKRQQYVFRLIADRWYVTLGLQVLAIVIAWSVSVPLGIWAARRAGTRREHAVATGLFAAWSLPSFVVGTVLLALLCTDSTDSKALFPNRGLTSPDTVWMSGGGLVLDWLWHAALPLLVLSYASFTALSRYMRGSLLDQLGSDYLRTARAKGADEDRVIYRHAVPNSLITMITLGSGLLAALFGSSLFVEKIFSINGLSMLLYEAAVARDIPLVMGSTVISVVLLLVGILIADLLYAVADPRIRSRYA